VGVCYRIWELHTKWRLDMNNPIGKIIEDVRSIKDDGGESIDTEKLIDYLNDLKGNEQQSHEEMLEILKATHQLQIERFKLVANANFESFRSVNAAGANAAKSGMIINGGAAVALLAFVGNIWNKNPNVGTITEIAYGILFFCSGVFLAAFCTGITYIAQYCFSNVDDDENDKNYKWQMAGNIFNILAILTGFAALLFFCFGCYSAFEAIISHSKTT